MRLLHLIDLYVQILPSEESGSIWDGGELFENRVCVQNSEIGDYSLLRVNKNIIRVCLFCEGDIAWFIPSDEQWEIKTNATLIFDKYGYNLWFKFSLKPPEF